MIYPEEDFLQLSGLQHFKFCRRQWALIHIENQWAENLRTTDGAILHERAHDGNFAESRGDLLVTRDMRVFSPTLGVSGACDVLEFRRGSAGIPLKGRDGLWQPYPVEYKRGRPKEDSCDELQLCGQAICRRRCSAAKSRQARYITVRSAGAGRLPLQPLCAKKYVHFFMRCTTSMPAGGHRRCGRRRRAMPVRCASSACRS